MKLLALSLILASGTAFAGCPEGDIQYWPAVENASSYGGETTPNVRWICENGRYVEMDVVSTLPYTGYDSCREGTVMRFPDDDNASMYGGETTPDVPYVCRGGKFVKQYGNAYYGPRRSGHHGCREGAVMRFPDYDNASMYGGETVPDVPYVCRNGKFVKKYRH